MSLSKERTFQQVRSMQKCGGEGNRKGNCAENQTPCVILDWVGFWKTYGKGHLVDNWGCLNLIGLKIISQKIRRKRFKMFSIMNISIFNATIYFPSVLAFSILLSSFLHY